MEDSQLKDKKIAELEVRLCEMREDRDNWKRTARELGDEVYSLKSNPLVDSLADNVHSPAHYTQGGIETIDFIRAKLTTEEFLGYCKGNALKYVSRATHKGGLEDLHKAGVYLGWAVGGER